MMRMPRFCALPMLFLSATSISYGQGLKLPTQAELDAAPKWKHQAGGYKAGAGVDLRRFMPPIKNQGHQGSCSGWATAYYARTIIQKMTDPQWDNLTFAGEFSPSFVYNQLNGHTDGGISVLDACNFISEHGCATLSFMPYSDADYISPPSSAALNQGIKYKIAKPVVLRNGGEIREALSDGYVVVIGAQIDSRWEGGLYSIWNTNEWKLGEYDRRYYHQEPEYHALCVVGYDDAKSAFLVANSWGSDWRQDSREPGFFWASYDVMNTINLPDPTSNTDPFVDVAIAVKATSDAIANNVDPVITPDVVSSDDINLAQTDNYYGVGNDGRPNWKWTVYVTGGGTASVEKVVYHLHPTFTPPSVTIKDAANDFALTRVGWGTFKIRADIFLKGSSNPVQKDIDLKFTDQADSSAQRDELSLTNNSHITDQKSVIDGKSVSRFDWTAYVEGPQQTLDKIVKVTYHLHPSFPHPDIIVNKDRDHGCPLSVNGWGTFELRADVLLKDGTTVKLTHMLTFD